MSGVYTNTDQAQGTLQVNIRGMTGFGRVNTMVDGVTQSFFGTSADDGRFHDQTGTSAFGTPIDSNFLVSVSVEKGSFSGGHGGLMGSANFKTIGINELVREGRNFGFLGRLGYGTNGLGPNYMGAVAGKYELDEGFWGLLFAYAGRKITQNYTTGNGRKTDEPSIDGITPPFNPEVLTQKPQSYLLKLEYNPNSYTNSILSYRKYMTNLAGRKIDNDNYQVDFAFNPSDYLNFKALFAYNQSIQNYKDGGTYGLATIEKDVKGKNKAYTFDISEHLNANFGAFHLGTTLGFNLLDNEYKNSLDFSEESLAGGGLAMSPFQPRGMQRLFTYYFDNTFDLSIFEFNANLNLLQWQLKGFRPSCDEANFYCFPKGATNINKKGLNFNASLMFSAKIDELFTPFISYARTNRAPNAQEMFFSNNAGNGINPHLKPELANTYQIGFNSFKHGLLKDDDKFGLKALYYQSHIENYIYNEQFYLEDKNGNSSQFYMHLNSPKKLIFKGAEFELSYDANFMYFRGAYSRQDTSSVLSQTQFGMFGSNSLYELPKDYANFELGFRLAKGVSLGGITKYTGKAKRINPNQDEWTANPNNEYFPDPTTQELPKIPTIVDIYLILQILENFTLKYELQNVADKNYMDALNAYNTSAAQYNYDSNDNTIYLFDNAARGRTFVMSFEFRY